MSIPSKLLICPVRQKAYIVKLKAIGKEATRQRAVLGSTIAFPQENVSMHPEANLPHNLSELSRSLSIIFIGSKPPSDAQLSKVFRVNTKELKTVLDEFRSNGHVAFQTGTSWNRLKPILTVTFALSSKIVSTRWTLRANALSTARQERTQRLTMPLSKPLVLT
jgi:predicted transcriptional regulator